MTEIRSDITYKYSDIFHQICQPIFEKSPINFCSLARIFNDGTYTCFMSDPTWTDHYLKQHFKPTISLWIENAISLTAKGYQIWSLSNFFNTNADTKNLLTDCNIFNYNNGINIVDKHSDYYDVATFASPKSEGIESFFIHKQDIIRSYILYVKYKVFSDEILAREFNHHYLIPKSVNILDIIHDTNHLQLEINKYYVGSPLKMDDYLTQREMDCLLPFILGVPKKSMARKLNISIRTIEKHLDNIKNKCLIDDLAKMKLAFSCNHYITGMLATTLTKYI